MAVESGTDFLHFPGNNPPERQGECPIVVFFRSDVSAVSQTIGISAVDNAQIIVLSIIVIIRLYDSSHFKKQGVCDRFVFFHGSRHFYPQGMVRSLKIRPVLIDQTGISVPEKSLQGYHGITLEKASVEFCLSHNGNEYNTFIFIFGN